MNKLLCRLIGEDIELVTNLDTYLDQVFADAGQLEQVIMNLVVNARDAMPNGGKVTVSTANVKLDEYQVDLHIPVKKGPYVSLSVTDTGTGIDKEISFHLFEPFFTTKEQGKGTGLGLATVFGIVKQSEGTISVNSKVGEGTTFRIYLPRFEATMQEEEVKPAVISQSGSETVMLVEDDDLVRSLVKKALTQNGYNVIVARDGFEAIQLSELTKVKIDLVLTDMVMPEMNGIEVVHRIIHTHPEVKVLCMSGYTDKDINLNDIFGGNLHFIQKPFTPKTLNQKIREVLDIAPEVACITFSE